MGDLDAIQEHYLKRELLKFQLAKELQDLNNKDALRRFGFPFSVNDPKAITTGIPTKENNSSESAEEKLKRESIATTDFPMCSYLLREFVMTFPLLSKNIAVDQSFWQTKVQVFFEHFMSLGFSDSYDREKATKRKKVALKLTKIILLLFNSGIGSSQEIEYYETDKFKLSKEKVRKRSKIEEFAMPTTETLQQLVTQEPMYINQWDINIIACVKESTIANNKKWKKTQSVKNTSYVSSLSKSTQALTSGTIKSITSTSKWMTKTITSSPSSLFSKFSATGSSNASPNNYSSDDSSNSKHWFILKIRNKENPDEIIYTAKTYHDFKILAHNLKLESPGKKLPKLPHKTKQSISLTTRSELLPNGRVPSIPKEKFISSYETDCETLSSTQTSINNDGSKSNVILDNAQDIVKEIMENEGVDDGKDIDIEDDEEEVDDMESAFEEFEDATDSKTNTLVHEKMRTSLRQYLRRLSNDSDTADNLIFANFLSKQNLLDGSKFGSEVKEDIKHRELVDINNLTNQLTFQKLALQKSLALQNSMKDFKTSLLKDEEYLLTLVNELRDKTSISELSPLLQTFIEWFKIYLASIIYQLFLGNDNSYGFYTQVRKLHRLMPYTMMGQIMRFTNPMAMMKGMIDLFLAQPFGNYSLLQTMFSTILTEDLRSQTHVIKKLETIIVKQSKFASQVIKILKKFVDEDHFKESGYEGKSDDGVDFNMDIIHKESQTMDMPICLIVLMKYSETGAINSDAVTEIFESYNGWKLKEDNGLYFQHIKDLFQLYIKEKDKRLMRRLWQDPELSRLLKAMVTMIYEPMVKVFKIARMDIALKNFERFMNDLIKLMDDIINGQLDNSTQFNIIENIIHLVTKHQDSFFSFVHDVYINDTEGIFEGFIKWFSKIIRFLQRSKYGTDESQRIDLNKIIAEMGEDSELLKKQVDAVIEKKVESRKLYKELVDTKTKTNGVEDGKKHTRHAASDEHVNAQNFMDHRWKQVSSMVMPDSTTSLGLHEGDLVDLDLDAKDYDYLQKDANTELEQKYQDILNKTVDESAIEALTYSQFEPLLKQLLL